MDVVLDWGMELPGMHVGDRGRQAAAVEGPRQSALGEINLKSHAKEGIRLVDE